MSTPLRLILFSSVLLLIFLALCTGCARPINRTAERRVREMLPEILGTARAYRVHIDNAPQSTLGGRFTNVAIDGDDVQLANGLVLDSLHLDLKGVDFDTGNRQLRSIRETRFRATIGTSNLDEFVAGMAVDRSEKNANTAGGKVISDEPIRNIRISVGVKDIVTISADRIVLGLGVPFRLTGPVHIVPPRRIEIDPKRLVVVGIPFTGNPLQLIKQCFESSLDLSALPFPVVLTEVHTAPGTLTLFGTADVSALLARRQPVKGLRSAK